MPQPHTHHFQLRVPLTFNLNASYLGIFNPLPASFSSCPTASSHSLQIATIASPRYPRRRTPHYRSVVHHASADYHNGACNGPEDLCCFPCYATPCSYHSFGIFRPSRVAWFASSLSLDCWLGWREGRGRSRCLCSEGVHIREKVKTPEAGRLASQPAHEAEVISYFLHSSICCCM